MAEQRDKTGIDVSVTAGAERPAGEDTLAAAQDKLAECEREREETVTLLKQTRADFENYQKRAARDRDEERRHAVAPLARDLLPAFDNLQRAVDAARQVG